MARIRQAMRGDVLLDGRNIWNPLEMESLGFRYAGIGRAAHPAEENGQSRENGRS